VHITKSDYVTFCLHSAVVISLCAMASPFLLFLIDGTRFDGHVPFGCDLICSLVLSSLLYDNLSRFHNK